MVVWCMSVVDDIDCTTHSTFFILSLDNDLPEWISNWKPLWSKLKTFSDLNYSINGFTVFRKSLAVFCNSMEFSIVSSNYKFRNNNFSRNNSMRFLIPVRCFKYIEDLNFLFLLEFIKPTFVDIMNYESWFNSCSKFIMC